MPVIVVPALSGVRSLAHVVAVTRRLGYVPALDGIRGVAIVIVVALHTVALKPFPFFSNRWVEHPIEYGFLGVDLFFVLSGFLITTLLLVEWDGSDRVRFGAFYWRRVLRLLPALALLLVVVSGYGFVTGIPKRATVGTVLTVALYVKNYVNVNTTGISQLGLGHLWSLSVEEQFYLVWPAMLVGLLRFRRDWVVPCVLIVGAVLIGWHRWDVWVPHSHTLVLDAKLDRTEVGADGLLIGALAAWVRARLTVPAMLVPAAGWCGLIVVAWCFEHLLVIGSALYHGGLSAFDVAGRGRGLRLPRRACGAVRGYSRSHRCGCSAVSRTGSTCGIL